MVEVLTQKYDWTFEKARSFAAFLLPMLAYEPSERATAEQCLKHHWIKGTPPPNSIEAKEKMAAKDNQNLLAENGDSSRKITISPSKLVSATKEKTLKTSDANDLGDALSNSDELLTVNKNLLTNSSDFAVKTNKI